MGKICVVQPVYVAASKMELASGSGGNLPASNVMDDLFCVARSVEEPPAPPPYSGALILAVKIMLVLVYYSTFVVGCFLNFLVIYLVIRYFTLCHLGSLCRLWPLTCFNCLVRNCLVWLLYLPRSGFLVLVCV